MMWERAVALRADLRQALEEAVSLRAPKELVAQMYSTRRALDHSNPELTRAIGAAASALHAWDVWRRSKA
jgi:hypothetical protein